MEKLNAILAGVFLIVIVVAIAVTFYAIDYSSKLNAPPQDDNAVWKKLIGYSVGFWASAEGKVFVTDRVGWVHGYNASTGESLWNTSVSSDRDYRPITAIGDGVYVSADQTVLRMNATTGNVEKQYMISSADNDYQFEKVTSFSIEEQKLVVHYTDEGMVTYDLQSGQALWSKHPSLGSRVYQSIVYFPKNSLPFIQYTHANLSTEAIDLDDGSIVWNYSGAANPIVTEDRVILANYASVQTYQSTPSNQSPKEHFIVCLNRTTGQKLWTTNPQYLIFNEFVHNDSLLFASYDGCFYALNINNGLIEWKMQIADLSPKNGNYTLPSPVDCLIREPFVDENTGRLLWIVASNNHGNSVDTRKYTILSLDLQTGEEKLSSSLEPMYLQVVGEKKNTVLLNDHFFVQDGLNMFSFDAKTGLISWIKNNPEQMAYPLLVDDKVIVVMGSYLAAYR